MKQIRLSLKKNKIRKIREGDYPKFFDLILNEDEKRQFQTS